ncbi:MAG: hypothetical protein DMD91_16430 [Candidatus Rokuibacteriota bacterium]|nr:MAG: hypothetical protein DMD91_16430 [Candidatus Rokubacteria bacterium]
MSKRRRPPPSASRTDAPDGSGVAAVRAHVDDLLARGKTRDAVEAARQLYKAARTAETEALLVDAYGARIRALMATGLTREARELASLVVERHPGTRARILPLLHETAARAGGDLGPLLAGLASADPATRRDLERTLGRVLTDCRALAEDPRLSDGDPLRQAARAASELFQAVTSGPLPDGALARLDGVSRHSPLAPWKLLIRAIDAYYRRDDAAVLANLSAIPPDAAPARLAPLLRCLAGEAKPIDRPSLGDRVLLDKVSGGRARFRTELAGLIDAIRGRDQRQALVAARNLIETARSASDTFMPTFASTLLTHWLHANFDPRPLMTLLVRGRSDVGTLRQLALALERVGAWEAAVPAWDGYLATAQQIAAMPHTGREPSRLLLHMAELIPTDIDELLDVADVEDEEELQELIRDGALPDCLDRGRLLERARTADPDARVFRALVAHWETRDPRRAEREADAWRARHPRDLEPLLFLARAAERRGAHRKALDWLDAAEVLDRVHPDVRRSRFRVLLSSGERHLRDRQVSAALRDIDRLAVGPEAAAGDRPAYVAALRWAAARCAGETASAAERRRDLGERLGNPVLLNLVLASVAATIGLDTGGDVGVDPSTAMPKVAAVEGLARAADLLLALDRPLHAPPDLVRRIELNPRGAAPAHLYSLCTLGLRTNRQSLAYAASGAGLEADTELTHRFLLARGRALATGRHEQERERALRCLRAARTLATRLRDTETSREASLALRELELPPWSMDEAPEEDDLPPAAIRRVIEDERNATAAPSFTALPPRGRRRRRPDRRRPSLPSEAQPFLDFKEREL